MIRKNIKYFCKDFTKIENYQEAINDETQYWQLHHRLEDTGLSKQDLIERNLYRKRPPEELIFLTSKEHHKLHFFGKKLSFETKQKISEAVKGEKHPMYGKKGEKCPLYGRHHSTDAIEKISLAVKGEKHPLYGKKKVWDNEEHTSWHWEKIS